MTADEMVNKKKHNFLAQLFMPYFLVWLGLHLHCLVAS